MSAIPFYTRPFGKAFPETDNSVLYETFTELTDDDHEVNLSEMINVLAEKIDIQRKYVMNQQMLGIEVLLLATWQNEAATQAARCIVTAEKNGEKLELSMKPAEVITSLIKTLSLSSRRVLQVLDRQEYYSKEKLHIFEKLCTVYTTIRRLKITRQAILNDTLKVNTEVQNASKAQAPSEEPKAITGITADKTFSQLPPHSSLPAPIPQSPRVEAPGKNVSTRREAATSVAARILEKAKNKSVNSNTKAVPFEPPSAQETLDLVLATAKKYGLGVCGLPSNNSP